MVKKFPWGSPTSATFFKRYVRPVKAAGTLVWVHNDLSNIVSEMLEAAALRGVEFPEDTGGYLKYLDGKDPRESGLGFRHIEGMTPQDYEPWGFSSNGVVIWFSADRSELPALSELAETRRVMRTTPFVGGKTGEWSSLRPGERSVMLGDKGDDVVTFQLTMSLSSIEGEFDKEAENVVRYMQRRSGLVENGVLDSNVWNLILPNSLNGRIEYGSQGTVVRVLQSLLRAYDWAYDVEVTGRYDQVTMQAVRQLQDVYALRLSGSMACPEWAILLGRDLRNV